MGERAKPARTLAAADGARGSGAPLPGRGVVDRPDPGGDGRRRSGPDRAPALPGPFRRAPVGGTFADVDRSARALAGALAADGVGPGDVVVFQLPNWVEAGITFWAAAYLGAVVVPIVHFYGPKEVEYILRMTGPGRGGHRRPLRPQRLPGQLRRPPLTPARDPVVGGPAGTPGRRPAGRRRRPSSRSSVASPWPHPLPVDPDAPAIIGFTSGTTRDPKGVIHSHRTIGCEARQLDYMFPTGWAAHDHRGTGGALHRDAQRLPRAHAPREVGRT